MVSDYRPPLVCGTSRHAWTALRSNVSNYGCRIEYLTPVVNLNTASRQSDPACLLAERIVTCSPRGYRVEGPSEVAVNASPHLWNKVQYSIRVEYNVSKSIRRRQLEAGYRVSVGQPAASQSCVLSNWARHTPPDPTHRLSHFSPINAL